MASPNPNVGVQDPRAPGILPSDPNEIDPTQEVPTEEVPVKAEPLAEPDVSGSVPPPQAPGIIPKPKRPLLRPGLLHPASSGNPFEEPPPGPDPDELKMVTMPTVQPISHETKSVVDFTNFVIGGEMSAIGMSLDATGVHWSLEALKQQWSETPLWMNLLNSTSLVGTVVFPLAAAAHSTYKFGKLGQALGTIAPEAEEILKFKSLGLLDENVTEVSSATLYKLRKLEHAKTKYAEMDAGIEALREGKPAQNPIQMASAMFDRRFANTYYKLTSSSEVRTAYHTSLDKLWKNENLGQFFMDMPDEEMGKDIVKSWFHDMNPTAFPKVELSAKDAVWSERMKTAMKEHQLTMLEEGGITQETFDKVGTMHIPATYATEELKDMSSARTYIVPTERKLKAKKTGFLTEEVPEQRYVAMRVTRIPRLDSPNLLERKSDLPTVYSKLVNDELITHPTQLTIRGLVEDKLILNNLRFVRDVAVNAKHAVSYDTIMSKYISQGLPIPKDYISLNALPNSAVIERMIRKIPDGSGIKFLGPNGELPFIRKSVFDEIASETGMFAQTQHAADMLDVMTTIMKTSKTAFNIPTHLQNTGGNMVFLAQAGMNPLAPENINMMHDLGKTFNQVYELRHAAKDLSHKQFFSAENMKGINLGKMKINGRTFDLSEELFDPVTQELIEDSAFDSAEGASHLTNLLGRLREDQTLTKATIKTYLKAKDIAQIGGKVKWMDAATKAYAAEDVIPKMAMYMKLRGEGLTRSAAVLEVGRRMPMYQTVGSSIGTARKFLFPWASFPTEALRITKNNLMDHPLKMLPWLHMPGIIQGLYHEVDPDFNLGQTDLAKRMLPQYAQTPQTVVGRSGVLGPAIAGVSGAFTGAIAGTVMGGATGAAIGAAAGGIAGYAGAKALSSKEQEDEIRGAVLNYVPHSSFFIKSNSPDTQTSDFMDVVPAEPLSILRSILDVTTGKGSYGEEIASKGPVDTMSKVIAGMIGFLSPPIIQKYGFRTTTPDVSLTSLIGGGGLGIDPTNISQLQIDSGQWLDPRTNKPGNFTYSGLLNNLGVIKSYVGSPAQMGANKMREDKYAEQVRSYLAKNLNYYTKNGNNDAAAAVLKDIMATFSMQHAGNGYEAQKKYSQWLERNKKTLWQDPRLRTLAMPDFERMVNEAGRFSAESRGVVSQKLLNALRTEINLRGGK